MTMPEQKKAVVPRLRFPEFRDAGPWEVKQLGELLDYERPDKYIVESDNYEPQGIPVLTANKSFVLGYTSEQNGIYEDLPAIIFDDFTTDKKFVDFPFKVKSSAIKILKPKGENVIRFVFELMNLIQFDPGQHKRYYISEYQHISVLVPNTAEQQKIADCLSSPDELIELEAKKLEALQAHKQGLMQQLFPREGETTPRLRFPEFRDAGPWEVKRLGEIAEITMGASPPSAAYNDKCEGLPLLQGNADIRDNRSAPRVHTRIVTKVCWPGDILFSVRAPVGQVAKSQHHACIGRGLCALRTIRQSVHQEFLYQWFLAYAQRWERLSQGGTFDAINSDDLNKSEIRAPSLTEQQKIADCLSSLDELIELQAKQLEALQTHKKGLMQQLFPQEIDL
jgi:type I restriction enzyme S subunit